MPSRRFVVAGLGTGFAVPTAALAQQHAGHNPLYAHLRDPSATGLPPGAEGQRFAYSPAPPAASPGRWVERAMLPLPRSETAWATAETDRMHVVGGRMDTFHFNTGLHLAYDPAADKWQERAPLPTPRSGHGGVLYRGRLFVMGVEGTRRVFAQNEAYDPAADGWEVFAPMPTPRHGLGAAVEADAIHVAGGPVMGGGVQSAIHEAFTLG